MTLPNESLRHVGFIGLAGAPNAGKSTLLNRLIGQKVSIVSEKPQTTRDRIGGILTNDRMQAIFVDLPGLLETTDRFNANLVENAQLALRDVDLVWHLRDARRPDDPRDAIVARVVREAGKPAWLIWNKMDAARRKPPPSEDQWHERTFAISARTGAGIDPLTEALSEALPAGPLLYDPDQICDRDLRFLAGELVREKLFRHLGEEIPYATAVQIECFEEKPGEKIFIRAVILTEREAHKPIIIGEGGRKLKAIGRAARSEIEELCQAPVFLELWVKVRPKWRRDPRQLRVLGYDRSSRERS